MADAEDVTSGPPAPETSPPPALETSPPPPESLQFTIAIIGPRGSGKTTLIRSLCNHTERFGPGFLDSYFRDEGGEHGVERDSYPPLPNVTLLDCPGYKPGDSAMVYVDSIKPDTVHCLVVTLGETITDADLQLLGAIKHLGKPICMVQTHIDLTLHTEKRQQGKGYWRGQTLMGMRATAQEQLGGHGMPGSGIFLVSGLEPQNYDFQGMVDYIEKEVLQWKRPVPFTTEPHCQELVSVFEVQCDQEGLSEFCSLLSIFLDNPPPVSAVVGVTGSDKEATVSALCEPQLSGLIVKPLPGPGTPPMAVEQYLQNLQSEACDVYLILGSGMDNSSRAILVEALVAAGKHCMLIGGEGDRRPKHDANGQEGASKKCHAGTDLPGLRVALEKGAPQLVRERLLHAIPIIIVQLVRRERRRLMMGIYDICLDVCAKSSEGHLQDALSTLSSKLSSFRSRFGLDEDSLTLISQVTGCSPEDLRAEIQCPLAQDPSEDQLLQLTSQPLSLTELVWSYVPRWGGGEEASSKLSADRTYRLLVEAVWGMAEDAERVLLHGCTNQKVAKERTAFCHWPCV
ncbi:interferon-inducible GTPase 5-like [Anomaloglossus baeobatrachus]|uniref:interferon-inducible GTPase 5-like n=1 Tax=Anomaloglossus baeobatrachus TaxID=238106 RepID=UPI003F4F57F6